MKNKYKFSVVLPVYNGEEYLTEALDSVINQSIGFEDNIQFIIVNDGSTDGSADICKKYRDMYPDNIVYVEKEN
ncbi:MAG: glycosyltransferase family 2 protein, partial [Eubacterium sp.]|nr:glycosyltransferase family 2 protein [Eubacterium sp.]